MPDFVRLPDVAMVALRSREAGILPCVGSSIVIDGDTIVALGPDEWLVIAADGDAQALVTRAEALCASGGVAVDVSGNRVRFAVTGPDARDLLARACSIDLDALKTGSAVATMFARTQAIVIAESERYLVLPRRSFADYVATWVGAAVE